MTLSENFKNNEFYNSIENTIKDRFSSSMYGTFVIAWCLWNWQAIYVTFFVDQDIIFQSLQQFKIDYIWTTYYVNWNWYTWWKVLVGPVLSVILALWGLSLLDLQCFKKTCSNKFKQEKIRIDQERELEEGKKEVLEVKESNVLKEKEIEKEMTEEERWKIEYNDLFLKRGGYLFDALEELKQSLYAHAGLISSGFETIIEADNLAWLHANSLINLSPDSRMVIATDKGKYFLGKYLQDKQEVMKG